MTTTQRITKYTLMFLLIVSTISSVVISKDILAMSEHDSHEHKRIEKHSDHDEEESPHADEHGHENEHQDDHGHEGHVEISVDNAREAGIVNLIADSAQIKKSITVYGKAEIKPNAISQVKARFAGLITRVNVDVGDNVNAGDILVEVESSDSLKKYNITAPISGVVAERLANPGEIAELQTLITIENYAQLWAKFQIFPSQQVSVKKGQAVTILSPKHSSMHSLKPPSNLLSIKAAQVKSSQSTILHLLANKNQPFITAIVPINNANNLWSPGKMLTGSIVTSEEKVTIAVDNRAIQEIEGQRVVFVRNKGGYEKRELTLGQTDGELTEVFAGIDAGEQYAVINSYLLKADLGKAGAAHVH